MNPLKEKYEDYMAKKLSSERLLAACMAAPDDEALDEMSDRAYRAECDALEDLAREMERFTGGRIDRTTAKRMACCPKYSERLADLMSRWAA